MWKRACIPLLIGEIDEHGTFLTEKQQAGEVRMVVHIWHKVYKQLYHRTN